MKTFDEFLQEKDNHSIVSGLPSTAAKTHKAVIRTAGGIIHSHTENEGVHTIVHSTKRGAMTVSKIHPSSERNKTSTIFSRKATDAEKNEYSSKHE